MLSTSEYFVERNVCPVCHSTHQTTLFSAPYTSPKVRGNIESHYRNQGKVDFTILEDIDYTVLKCLDCDLIFQRMAPLPAMLDIIYNQFIDPGKLKALEHSRLTIDNFNEIARRMADVFRSIGKEPKDIRLLDFGFGYGRWARVAAAMGATVYAIEISPEKIAYAESIGIKTITEADLHDHRFDVVHTEQVFEHLTDPSAVFDMLAQCVADDGVFKIAAPQQGKIERLLRTQGLLEYSPFEFDFKKGHHDFHTIAPLEHINAFSRKAVAHLARRGGFTVCTGYFGAQHVDLDLGSLNLFTTSCRAWAMRIAKDLYVRVGPGRRDNSCYLLFRDRRVLGGQHHKPMLAN